MREVYEISDFGFRISDLRQLQSAFRPGPPPIITGAGIPQSAICR